MKGFDRKICLRKKVWIYFFFTIAMICMMGVSLAEGQENPRRSHIEETMQWGLEQEKSRTLFTGLLRFLSGTPSVMISCNQIPTLSEPGVFSVSVANDDGSDWRFEYAIQDKGRDSGGYIFFGSKTENMTFRNFEFFTEGSYRLWVFLYRNGEEDHVAYAAYSFTVGGEAGRQTLEEKIQEIVAECTAAGDEWQTALNLHDWLTMHMYYDPNYEYYGADAVFRGKGVCDSYSKAFQMLCDTAGITGDRVVSQLGNHAWNAIQLDGEWYQVDVTWDDPKGATQAISGQERYDYFCLNDDLMFLDHVESDASFKPGCTSLDANWMLKRGTLNQMGNAIIRGTNITYYSDLIASELNAAESSFTVDCEQTFYILRSQDDGIRYSSSAASNAAAKRGWTLLAMKLSREPFALANGQQVAILVEFDRNLSAFSCRVIGSVLSFAAEDQADEGVAFAMTAETYGPADTLLLYENMDGAEILLESWDAEGNSTVNGDVRTWNVSRIFTEDRRYNLVIRPGISSGNKVIPAVVFQTHALNVVDPNYVVENGVLTAYTGPNVTEFTIPNNLDVTVVGNGEKLIRDMSSLQRIVIPEGVTEIGAWAFTENYNLTEVVLPKNLETIGEAAFYSNSNLVSINLPDGLTEIPVAMLEECINLTSVDIPSSVTTIASDAFKSCNKLLLEIPETVQTIGNKDTISYAAKIRLYYGSYAWRFCNTQQIDYQVIGGILGAGTKDEVTQIPLGESVTLQGTMDVAAEYLYVYYSDTTLVGKYSKEECQAAYYDDDGIPRLTWSITVIPEKMDTALNVQSGYSANGPTGTYIPVSLAIHQNGFVIVNGQLLKYVGSDTDPVIPEGVVSLGTALKNNSKLKSVTLPSSLTSLNSNNFSGCTLLKTIRYPAGLSCAESFSDTRKQLIGEILSMEMDIGEDGLESLREVTFSVKTDVGALYLRLYKGDTLLFSWPAEGNSVADAVTRTWTVQYTPDDYQDINLTLKSGMTAEGTVESQTIVIQTMYAMDSNSVLTRCPSAGDIIIPEWLHVRALKNSLFSGKTGLTGITIPEGVENTGELTFFGCTGLTEVYLPETLKTIGDGVFYDCRNLTEIEIPDSVETLNGTPFLDCPAVLVVSQDSAAYNWAVANNRQYRLRLTWSALQDLLNQENEEIEISLFSDVKAKADDTFLTIPEGKTVTLDLNGYKIDRNLSSPVLDGYVLKISSGATLVLQDNNTAGTGLITGEMCLSDLEACIMNDGTFVMHSGTIAGNKGCAVNGDGTFIMEGGKITRNEGYAAVALASANSVMIMSGGEIVDNPTKGVACTSGEFHVSGTIKIENNDKDVCLGTGKAIIIDGKLDSDSLIGVYTFSIPSTTEAKTITSGFFDKNGVPQVSCTNFVSNYHYIKIMQGEELALANGSQFEMDDPDFVLPAGIRTIEAEAFMGSNVSVIEIPNGTEQVSIASKAFADCKTLRQIHIPSNVTSIANDAFDEYLAIVIFGTYGSCAQTYAETHDNCTFIYKADH